MNPLLISIPNSSSSHEYPIHFESGAHAHISNYIENGQYSKILWIYDRNVKGFWGTVTPMGQSEYALPVEGEAQKSTAILNELWQVFLKAGLDRQSLVISVGGGATCDVVGFAAATYMRGIRFINVPTTLLSMVDSSIGGKNGINVGAIKNLTGTFYHPEAVIIDPEFLKTLPTQELTSGYAEAIKHGLIADEALFKSYFGKTVQSLTQTELLKLIRRNCEVKAEVVSKDPEEKGLRKVLNFGHTVGHAFESLSHEVGNPLLHGHAIGLGMLAEIQIGIKLGLGSETLFTELRTLLELNQLPVKAPQFTVSTMMDKIKADKKNRSGKFLFSLLRAAGECEYDVEVPEQIVGDILGIFID